MKECIRMQIQLEVFLWFTSMQPRLGSLYYSYTFQKPKAPSLMEVASG